MTLRRALAPLAALALVLAPAPALARRHIVAPGDPGSAQYQEDVPTAAGSQPAVSLRTPVSAPPAVTLPPVAVRKLIHKGSAGHTTISLAQQGTPPPTPTTTSHSQPTLSYRTTAAATLVANSLFGSGGGMGVFLPVIIFIALGATVLFLVIRRVR